MIASPPVARTEVKVPICTVAQLLNGATERLDTAGIDTPRLDAEVLLAETLKLGRAALHGHPERAVDSRSAEAFENAIARRERREPLAYIVGHKEFWSLDFEVTPDVLIPRPETEVAVEIAVDLLRDLERPTVCDVGTGSGCLAIAIASEVTGANVVATDLSAAALAVAKRNVGRHGLEGRIDLVQSDLFAALGTRRFDVVISNPPYVDSKTPFDELGASGTQADAGSFSPTLSPEVRYEPPLALFAVADGVDTIRRLIPEAVAHLNPGGRLVIEIGATQGRAVEALAAAAGLSDIRIANDYAGLPRVLVARAV